MVRSNFWLITTLVSTACADITTDVGRALVEASQRHDDDGGDADGSEGSIAECPAEGNGTERACVVDSAGHAYSVDDGPLPLITAPPPYGLRFRFERAVRLTQADLETEGPDASIEVYAATASEVSARAAMAEIDGERIAARALATPDGGMLVLVDAAPQTLTAVMIQLWYGELLARHFPLPRGAVCTGAEDCGHFGYGARFFVAPSSPTMDPGQAGSGAEN